MNLLDVVSLSTPRAPTDAGDKLIAQALAASARGDAAALLYAYERDNARRPNERAMLERILGHHRDAYHALRGEIFAAMGTLPESLQGNDRLSSFAKTGPIVTSDTLRAIADRLGFVLMPLSYLAPAACEDMPSAAIRRFAEAFPHHSLYVIAPVAAYSIQNHVQAQQDNLLYAGKPVAQAFMALSVCVPMFRAITRDLSAAQETLKHHAVHIETFNQQIRDLHARNAQTQEELKSVTRRLEQIHADLERQKAVALAQDPMVFGLPIGRSLTDSVLCPLGPAWGPDFEAAVLPALGLELVKGQRARLEAFYKQVL